MARAIERQKERSKQDAERRKAQAAAKPKYRNPRLAEVRIKQGLPAEASGEDSPWQRYSPVALPELDEVVAGGPDDYRFVKLEDLSGHSGKITLIGVAPNAARALSCGGDGKLILWDLEKRSAIATHDISNQGEAQSCAISNDSKVALLIGEKGNVTKWDLETGQNSGKLELPNERFQLVAFSPDPNIAAVMHNDTTLSLLDVAKLEIFDLIELHSPPLSQRSADDSAVMPAVKGKMMMTFLNDAQSILLARGRSFQCYEIKRGDKATPPDPRSIRPSTGSFSSRQGRHGIDYAIFKDDQCISAVFNDGVVMTTVIARKKTSPDQASPKSKPVTAASTFGRPTDVKDLAILPGGHFLAAYAGGESIDMWNFDGQNTGARFGGPVTGVSAAAICPDGRHALSGYDDGRLTLYQLPRPTNVATPELDKLPQVARAALDQGKFDELEKIGNDLRSSRPLDNNGEHIYARFYTALSQPVEFTEVDFLKVIKRLEDWLAAKEDSTFARIALAHAYTRFGWQARGSGFIGTVSAEGASLFEERLRIAAKHLIEAQKAQPDDPAVYDAEIIAGKGLGVGKERLEKMLAAGVKADPKYHPLYTSIGPCLLPRWYGEPEDVAKFLDNVLKENPGDDGLAIYARVVGDLKCYESNTSLELLGLDLQKVDAGATVLLKEFPYSTKIMSLACWCACNRRDREAARDLFGWMGDDVDSRIFGGTELRNRLRHWAFDDLHTTNEEHNELVSFDSLTAVEFSQDGKKIAVAGAERLQQVTLWDAEKCTRIAVLPHPTTVLGLGFSPDGSQLVTAGGNDTEPQLLLWSLGDKPDLVELEGPLGELHCAAFSPDGKWIAAGGIDKTVWIWNAEDLDAKPTQIDVKGNINRLRFSVDGQLLAVCSDRSASVFSVPQFEPAFALASPNGIGIWDIALTGQNLVISGDPHYIGKCAFDNSKPFQYRIETNNFQRRIATRVDVSPDGKLLAAAISEATVPKQPELSRVDIYDVESGDLLGGYPAHHERTSGLRFSPDGKKLATVSWDGTLQIASLPPLDADAHPQPYRPNMRPTVQRSTKTEQK